MRKKQSSSKLQIFTYIMLILASVVIISCGAYFLYEKYQTYKLNEEIEKDKSAKEFSFCIEDSLCVSNDYKLIGNTLFFNIQVMQGTKYIKDEYLKYYKDRFAKNKSKVKLKDYSDKIDVTYNMNELLEKVYTKQFDIDKWWKVANLVEEELSMLFAINIYTKDYIQIYRHKVSSDNTRSVSLSDSNTGFILGASYTGKINLTKEIAENFNQTSMGWSKQLVNALKDF